MEYALIEIDDRKQREETRFEAIGYIDERLHVMLFCLRETAVRIIRLRKANSREVKPISLYTSQPCRLRPT